MKQLLHAEEAQPALFVFLGNHINYFKLQNPAVFSVTAQTFYHIEHKDTQMIVLMDLKHKGKNRKMLIKTFSLIVIIDMLVCGEYCRESASLFFVLFCCFCQTKQNPFLKLI